MFFTSQSCRGKKSRSRVMRLAASISGVMAKESAALEEDDEEEDEDNEDDMFSLRSALRGVGW
jgi:hypothetical protein